jgi:RecA-family ATPase
MDNIIQKQLEKVYDRGDGGFQTKSNAEILAETKGILKPKQKLSKIGYTFGELQELDLPKRNEIIKGLAPYENGLLNAVTNVGKTTLIRNLAISLILGLPFPPLSDGGKQYRVAIIDSEDTLSFLRYDVSNMSKNYTYEEKNLIRENLYVICDISFGDEDLKLNKQEHFNRIVSDLTEFKPDIIFVDTISASFAIRNENDNSEVKECVMKPLKRLAHLTKAAVLVSHHIGKAKIEDGATRENAHKGRGASAFSDLSRVVFNLEKDRVNDSVILSCAKLKGEKFDDTVLNYEKERRWFVPQVAQKVMTNYEILLSRLDSNRYYKRKEIEEIVADKITLSTLKRNLDIALERGDIQKEGSFYVLAHSAQAYKPEPNEPIHNINDENALDVVPDVTANCHEPEINEDDWGEIS